MRATSGYHQSNSIKQDIIVFTPKIDELKLGDILLTRDSTIVSNVVRAATGGGFSHAILHIGQGTYIHANADGVHFGNIQRLLFKKIDAFVLLRLKVEASSSVLEDICNYARTMKGMEYSKKEALGTVLKKSKGINDQSNRQFCSRLIAQAFENCGINLVCDSTYCTPNDLRDSKLLKTVDVNPIRLGRSDVEAAKVYGPLDTETQQTNNLFATIRSICDEDVQNIGQLVELLFRKPYFDSSIAKVLKESGYLTSLHMDKTAHPWRYDTSLFLSMPVSKEEKIRNAKLDIESLTGTKSRCEEMLDLYERLLNIKDLKVIRLFREMQRDTIKQANIVLRNADFVIRELDRS